MNIFGFTNNNNCKGCFPSLKCCSKEEDSSSEEEPIKSVNKRIDDIKERHFDHDEKRCHSGDISVNVNINRYEESD